MPSKKPPVMSETEAKQVVNYITTKNTRKANRASKASDAARPELRAPRWFIYRRVSGPGQTSAEDNGHQDLEGVAYVESQGGELQEECVFVEEISASKVLFRDRPQAQRLMEKLRDGDNLVVWAMDRLGRRVQDVVETIEYFVDTGVTVHTVTPPMVWNPKSAISRFILLLFASLAELESRTISERAKAAIAARKAMGLPYHGARKFCYRRIWGMKKQPGGGMIRGVVRYERDEEELRRLLTAACEIAAGRTARSIIKEWKANGVHPVDTTSKYWTEEQICIALRYLRTDPEYYGHDVALALESPGSVAAALLPPEEPPDQP